MTSKKQITLVVILSSLVLFALIVLVGPKELTEKWLNHASSLIDTQLWQKQSNDSIKPPSFESFKQQSSPKVRTTTSRNDADINNTDGIGGNNVNDDDNVGDEVVETTRVRMLTSARRFWGLSRKSKNETYPNMTPGVPVFAESDFMLNQICMAKYPSVFYATVEERRGDERRILCQAVFLTPKFLLFGNKCLNSYHQV